MPEPSGEGAWCEAGGGAAEELRPGPQSTGPDEPQACVCSSTIKEDLRLHAPLPSAPPAKVTRGLQLSSKRLGGSGRGPRGQPGPQQ